MEEDAMEEMKYELTILMPCLNEEANLAYSIQAAKRFLDTNRVSGEVLIVDNGSTDDSVSIAKQEGARVVTETQRGYGNALRKGIQSAYGAYIIMGDCDTTYDFEHLMPYLEQLRNGYALVMGNRFAGGIQKGAMPFSHRYLGVPVLSWLGRIRYNVPIKDFHCGLRGFHRDTALGLNFRTTGMEFATEIIALFAKSGATITEVPTTLSVSQKPRQPHLKAIRDGLRHLRYMILGN